MKYITITEVKIRHCGKVSNEAWGKYLSGEITLNDLYSYYFNEISTDNDYYDVTEVEDIEG